MPDLDIVERNLRPIWRRVYRLIKGNQPLESTVDVMVSALAKQLREENGAPGLAEAATLGSVGSGMDEGTFADACRALELSFGFSAGGRGTAESARRLRINIEDGRALSGAVPLAEERCRGILDRYLFGRLQPFVGLGLALADYSTLDELRETICSAAAPQIRELARRLVKDPSAGHLRAPRATPRRPTTIALLDEPLLVLGKS